MCGPRHLIKRNKAVVKPVHTGGNGHGDTDDIGYGSYTLMGASPVWIEVVFSDTDIWWFDKRPTIMSEVSDLILL